jgi:hypothetical protein
MDLCVRTSASGSLLCKPSEKPADSPFHSPRASDYYLVHRTRSPSRLRSAQTDLAPSASSYSPLVQLPRPAALWRLASRSVGNERDRARHGLNKERKLLMAMMVPSFFYLLLNIRIETSVGFRKKIERCMPFSLGSLLINGREGRRETEGEPLGPTCL